MPNSLPLFYRNPVMLDGALHRARRVATKNQDYGFAGQTNAVPITLIELPQIMMNYPVVFTGSGVPFPVALMGLRDGQNLFVDDAGCWQVGLYVPAYIRRYPFIFASPDGTAGRDATLTLCIDDVPEWLLSDGQDGEALFDEAGQPTAITDNALEFCKSYHAASAETLRFATALQDSGILVERNATIQIEGQKPFQLTGFRQVDEDKLRNLPAEIVTAWHCEGWLAMVYAHVLSNQHWQRLFDMQQMFDASQQ